MGEIINLRTRRKQAARADARAKGHQAAVTHGLSKAVKALDAARAAKAARDLEAHRLEAPGNRTDGGQDSGQDEGQDGGQNGGRD